MSKNPRETKKVNVLIKYHRMLPTFSIQKQKILQRPLSLTTAGLSSQHW